MPPCPSVAAEVERSLNDNGRLKAVVFGHAALGVRALQAISDEQRRGLHALLDTDVDALKAHAVKLKDADARGRVVLDTVRAHCQCQPRFLRELDLLGPWDCTRQ